MSWLLRHWCPYKIPRWFSGDQLSRVAALEHGIQEDGVEFHMSFITSWAMMIVVRLIKLTTVTCQEDIVNEFGDEFVRQSNSLYSLRVSIPVDHVSSFRCPIFFLEYIRMDWDSIDKLMQYMFDF